MNRRARQGLVAMMMALNAVLLVVVSGALAAYWLWVLGPFVRSQETSKGELLASSHAGLLEAALQSGDGAAVRHTLERMVLLNEPLSQQPLLLRAELALLDGQRLQAQAVGGSTGAQPPIEIMLMSPASFDPIGTLTVFSNGYFYNKAKSDALRGMAAVVVAPTFLLALMNIAAGYVQQKRLDNARAREQASASRYAVELEERVRERTAQLEAANRDLEAFTYSVSHDLRAPLRAIDGYSRILVEDHAGRLEDDGRRVLGVVRGETQRMDRLITDLLALSRLGRQSLVADEVDMTALAAAARDEALANEPGRAVQVTLQSLPPARGAAVMIRQVWANLLANAVKFTRGRPDAIIEIGGSASAGEATYYVKDNGAGFDMRYADKLFKVFQRLHTEDEFEGTGIGLAIVHRIVSRHGGRVWAAGEVGAGATFSFTLPARKDAPS